MTSTSKNGNTYRLHAVFNIQNRRTGENVAFLSSDDNGIFSSEISTELLTGDYAITILPGWQLERITTSNPGTGGSAGKGGDPGQGGISGRSPGIGGQAPGAGGKGAPFPPILPEPPFSPGFEPAGAGGASGDDADAGDPGFPSGGSGKGDPFPTAGRGGGFPVGGRAPIGGSPQIGGTGPIGGEFVPAQLINDAIQVFTIFGGDDVSIIYQFKVGDDVIPFDRGRLHVGFIVEDEEVCVPPESPFDLERVMIEHSAEALEGISLLNVFSAIAEGEGQTTEPVLLYQQLIDSFATADQGRLEDAIHCGDEQTNGLPSLNGFPLTCNRRERFQFENIERWFPTAFVNRLELAPQNGAHCGQQRIIFANNAQNRAFLIFEAQIPNPAPDLGIQGCAPLAKFWLSQNDIDDPRARGERLFSAFFTGHPELSSAGFAPFVRAENYTIGTGQIRSNSFDDSPWTLREFKLALDGTSLTVLPFPVGESPNGALWDERLPTPQGDFCRQDFISAALGGLLSDNPAEMSFVVDQACKDAESLNNFTQDYSSRLGPNFRATLDSVFGPFGLNGEDIANRAQFGGSCIGCHQEAIGRRLGNGVNAPSSLGFVHVDEGGNISSAMRNVFLPRRLRAVTDLLDIPLPPDPCQGGSGGTSGTGGVAGRGGTSSGGFAGFAEGGVFAGGVAGDPVEEFPPPKDPPPPVPAPRLTITLPQASTPVEELERADAEIREVYGDKTISGKDARITH
jgi:hypothetical protein